MVRVISVLVASILVFAALLPACQRRLLYYPDTGVPSPADVARLGLDFWPGQGDYRGFIGLAGQEKALATVLVFHGNAGAAWQRSYYVDALEALGYRVVLAEYPGYGGRSGKPAEASLVADGLACLQLVRERYGEPVYLWGESLGSGVVAAVAHQSPVPVAGLVLLTPWDSLHELARSHFPLLPPRFLMREGYDSIANLQGFEGRVAVLVADQDEIVPTKHAMALFDSLTAHKKLWRFSRAGHNSWPAASSEIWWVEVMDFISGRAGT